VILGSIVCLIEAVCQKAGVQPQALAGLGLREIVNARTGQVLGWPNTPVWASAWAGLDVAGELEYPEFGAAPHHLELSTCSRTASEAVAVET